MSIVWALSSVYNRDSAFVCVADSQWMFAYV